MSLRASRDVVLEWYIAFRQLPFEPVDIKVCISCNFVTRATCECRAAAYCNKRCQALDWSDHRATCTERKRKQLCHAAQCNQSAMLWCPCLQRHYCCIGCQRKDWPLHRGTCSEHRTKHHGKP